MIEEDVYKVIQYSQGIKVPRIQDLIENWRENKSWFINKLFKEKIIYQVPEKLTFELDENSKKDKYEAFKDYVYELCTDFDLDKYLCSINYDEFFKNALAKDRDLPNGKKVKKGMKFLRTLRFLIEDDKLLEDIQNHASEIIQENKIEGYLCFSVHPLDFLSSSENTLNWRSCHSLDGEYRAGNLSYIQDSSTIIAYVCTGKDEKLPHFPEEVPWNNKKWRCLMFFNEQHNLIFAGRQYPFSAQSILDRANKELQKLLPSGKWTPWCNDYIEKYEHPGSLDITIFTEANYMPIRGKIYEKNNLVKDAGMSKHFNDVLHSCCYTHPYYMYNSIYYAGAVPQMTVGSAVKCLRCGEKLIDGSDSMMCHECECKYGHSDSDDYRTCDCCSQRTWYDDGEWVDDDFLCPNCIETETFVCEECGERYFNSARKYDKTKEKFVCSDCYVEEDL